MIHHHYQLILLQDEGLPLVSSLISTSYLSIAVQPNKFLISSFHIVLCLPTQIISIHKNVIKHVTRLLCLHSCEASPGGLISILSVVSSWKAHHWNHIDSVWKPCFQTVSKQYFTCICFPSRMGNTWETLCIGVYVCALWRWWINTSTCTTHTHLYMCDLITSSVSVLFYK